MERPVEENLDQFTSGRCCIVLKCPCILSSAYHDWLLGDDVDILPRLLLPLAGPEEFDEEDTAKLPVDLQYLEADKKREADPDVRKMLLESINQVRPARLLCFIKCCVEQLNFI